MALTIFDLDNTLLHGDSDHAWGEFLCDHELVDSTPYRKANDQFFEDYKNSCLDIDAYFSLSLEPLSRFSDDELKHYHQLFMQERIAKMILPKAEALVDSHRQQGDTLMVITATNRFVTAPIVKHFGIDLIIATEPEIIDGVYTGKVAGIPSYQDGKVTRLNEWLLAHQQTLTGSTFYSDSINDLPLLSLVDRPVAVDPDDKLRQHAEQHDWEIISLRA